MIRTRLVRAGWLGLVLVAASCPAGMVAGCAPPGSASETTVQDPPPLATEETTEALMKQQAKAKPRPRAAAPASRRDR